MKSRIIVGTAVLLCFIILAHLGPPSPDSALSQTTGVRAAAANVPITRDTLEEVCYVQVSTPHPSPASTVTTEVDSTDVALYEIAKQHGVTLPKDLSKNRRAVLKAAFAGVLHGVPYYYTWRSYTVTPGLRVNEFGEDLKVHDGNPNRTKKGLDCSGFVGWAYYTAGITWSGFACGGDAESGYVFMATPSMRMVDSMSEIAFEDIQPGDIGFIGNSASGKSDHTGIFLGLNTEGIATWIHCSGSQGAVCNTYDGFKVFYTVNGMED